MSRFSGGPSEATRRQIELLVTTSGQQAVDDLQARFDSFTRSMQANAQAYDAGHINIYKYIDATKSLSAEMVRAQQELDLARKKLADLDEWAGVTLQQIAALGDAAGSASTKMAGVGAAADRTAQQWKAGARALLEFSRGFEDFATAGFIGALNNIPTMVYNIGQAMGATQFAVTAWTAGISLVGTLAYAAYHNWNDFLKLLDIPVLQTTTERMNELAKATHKTIDEQAEYNRLRKQMHDQEREHEMRSKAEKETRRAVQEVIDETSVPGGMSGQERLIKGIGEVRAATGLTTGPSIAMHARAEALRQSMVGAEDNPLLYGRFKRIYEEFLRSKEYQQDVQKQESNYARDLIERAREGVGIEPLARLVERRPGAFAPKLAAGLRGATPEARAAAAIEKTRLAEELQAAEQGRQEAEREQKRALEDVPKRIQRDIERKARETEQHAREQTQIGRQLQHDREQAQHKQEMEDKRADAEAKRVEHEREQAVKATARRLGPAYGTGVREAFEANRARFLEQQAMAPEFRQTAREMEKLAGMKPAMSDEAKTLDLTKQLADALHRGRARDESGAVMGAEARRMVAAEMVREQARQADARFAGMQAQNAGLMNLMGADIKTQNTFAAVQAAQMDQMEAMKRQIQKNEGMANFMFRRMNGNRLQGGRTHQ